MLKGTVNRLKTIDINHRFLVGIGVWGEAEDENGEIDGT